MTRASLSPRVASMVLASTALSMMLASCGPQQVPLDVRFPSSETFLVSRSMRIRVYALEETSCPALVTAVSNGRDPGLDPLWESAAVTPCQVRAGITIPDVGGGRRGFLVEGLDSNGNNTILAGCADGEIYSGSRIDVAIYPTTRYDAAYDADPPTEEISARCAAEGL
ncbi:MAG: hypothetical protein J0L92_34430 [Deltaproteobacteria bacterium]|nr:hypothetical protein [Deltaproteobacteria bacterium]